MKTYQPHPSRSKPVPPRVIAEMKKRISESTEPWVTAASIDACKIKPRQPSAQLEIYLHEQAPDHARHPQLAIVTR